MVNAEIVFTSTLFATKRTISTKNTKHHTWSEPSFAVAVQRRTGLLRLLADVPERSRFVGWKGALRVALISVLLAPRVLQEQLAHGAGTIGRKTIGRNPNAASQITLSGVTSAPSLTPNKRDVFSASFFVFTFSIANALPTESFFTADLFGATFQELIVRFRFGFLPRSFHVSSTSLPTCFPAHSTNSEFSSARMKNGSPFRVSFVKTLPQGPGVNFTINRLSSVVILQNPPSYLPRTHGGTKPSAL
jgi:hypothetical protein